MLQQIKVAATLGVGIAVVAECGPCVLDDIIGIDVILEALARPEARGIQVKANSLLDLVVRIVTHQDVLISLVISPENIVSITLAQTVRIMQQYADEHGNTVGR